MGNEGSKLKGLIIDKNAVEVNDFWALYNAESPTTSNEDGRQLLSIFQGESIVKGQLWVIQGPMERAIRNLMIYRHPYILKYVTTWEQTGQKHLATERVRPLNDVFAQQRDIQICLGLRTILCSLIFLIEKANARHLNICNQSIYVTDNGSWRLAGFEFVWKAKEVNKQLLELAHPFRYAPAIDESNREQLEAIEQFAFAELCEEILEKCSKRSDKGGGDSAGTPHVQEFRSYCSTHLKHGNTELRPKLSAVLLHPYFNHEFVLIHSFLFELPLKSVQERQHFFTSLIDRLRHFDEEVVASQLTSDLLSRMVLLDPTAQLCVTPYVLRTKTETGQTAALFSQQTYVQYLLPQILKMFRQRDAQIRLILLEYFMEYVRLLSDEQLQRDILPHLAIGMSDTNDALVAKTLRSMADLVPILGASTVIGGQRSRLFSDGRPHAAVSTDGNTQSVEPRSITPVMNGNAVEEDDYMVSASPVPIESAATPLSLQLRLSPDGGEDDKNVVTLNDTLPEKLLALSVNTSSDSSSTTGSTAAHDQTLVNDSTIALENDAQGEEEDEEEDDEDEEAWSDWEATDELQRLNHHKTTTTTTPTTLQMNSSDIELSLNNLETTSSASSHATQGTQQSLTESYRTACSTISTNTTATAKSTQQQQSSKQHLICDDLSALDIQVQKTNPSRINGGDSPEFDFFKDMEPVIVGGSSSHHEPHHSTSPQKTIETTTTGVEIDASRFAADLNGGDSEQGWGIDDDVDDDDVVWGKGNNNNNQHSSDIDGAMSVT